MSSFRALNIVYEEESEDEIDDSKELQIEEALKLYQNALKWHSQGPDFYDQAEIAYNELFKSEIFAYAESLSESQWTEKYGGDVDDSDDALEDDLEVVLPSAPVGGEGAPSTLPQILYLAYKNHGLFRLDLLRTRLSQIEQNLLSETATNTGDSSLKTAAIALKYLSEALDRDESDSELWRRVARVGRFLGSQRIARYCLEMVLSNDEIDISSLESAFAHEQLAPLLSSIDDHAAHVQLRQGFSPRPVLTKSLKKNVDPYPYLQDVLLSPLSKSLKKQQKIEAVEIPKQTWASCGASILSRLIAEQGGNLDSVPGAAYILVFSSENDSRINGSNGNVPGGYGNMSRPRIMSVTETETLHVQIGDEVSLAPEAMRSAESSSISPLLHMADPILEKADSPPVSRRPSSLFGNKDLPAVDGPVRKPDGLVENEPSLQEARKRSLETAELADEQDIGRVRSKRIKARGSLADPSALKDTTIDDWTNWYIQQLKIYVEADDVALAAARRILSKLGCAMDGASGSEAEVHCQATISPQAHIIAKQDLKRMLDEWDLLKSKTFLQGDGFRDAALSPDFSSLIAQSTMRSAALFTCSVLEDKFDLKDLIDSAGPVPWMSLSQWSFCWLRGLLECRSVANDHPESLYESHLWPDELKKTVTQLLLMQDDFIYHQLDHHLHLTLRTSFVSSTSTTELMRPPILDESLVLLIQTIFELHLDIYGGICDPESATDTDSRAVQLERLYRWSNLASMAMNEVSSSHGIQHDSQNEWSPNVSYRFLWSSIVYQSLRDPAETEYTIACFHDFMDLVKQRPQESTQRLLIYLPNNTIMSEISVLAAEKEVSRLTTLEFFTNIFISSDDDPTGVVENLGSLLSFSVDPGRASTAEGDSDSAIVDDHLASADHPSPQDPRLIEALRFLDHADLSLKLFLWRKLQDAYSVINYPPQILVCTLRSFVLIVQYLTSSVYAHTTDMERQEGLLLWLYRADTLIEQVLALATTHVNAFECVDGAQLQAVVEASSALQEIVHVFVEWEDSIRVGQSQPTPQPTTAATKGQLKSAEKFRELWVRNWLLQYTLIKEAIVQNSETRVPAGDLVEYLRTVHKALGLRTYCSLANRAFLKLIKTEIWSMRDAKGWEAEVAQLIYDLYGLKISSNPNDMQDHACESAGLDRHIAFEILDIVLLHVNRLSIKELLKSDLKVTVDKISQIIKVPKLSSASARAFNKRLVHAYLKGPLNPVELYRSIRGLGELPRRKPTKEQLETDGYDTARKGWYFLLGHIALVKFRSQKRITASSMDDLTHAETFFKQDLEFDSEKWETWYRLGQVYDTQTDESVTWTAEKVENDMDGLVHLQRKAILCYSMAMAVARRIEDPTFEDTSKMADLCADYGSRLYASSREPFSMKAFQLDDFKRKFNGATTGMYESVPFQPMRLYSVWKLASTLLRQATKQKPRDWIPAFKLGKVLWKMHTFGSAEGQGSPSMTAASGTRPMIDHHTVVEPIIHAIGLVPEKRESRHSDKDPILEPHYKLVSIAHKLVRRQTITPSKACTMLKVVPYTRKVPDVIEPDDWEQYILAVLRALRSADKAGWHHRMVLRAAHIIYEENPDDVLAVHAAAAKHELTQQIFTKTMTLQVWKPDHEQPGRHFVYTGRYVAFFVHLLCKTNDKENFINLARRIRKKEGEFVNHSSIWNKLALSYLGLIRGNVPVAPGYDCLFFNSISPEDFSVDAARLEAWILCPGTQCAYIDELRDVMDFKKVNNLSSKGTEGLKGMAISDTIAEIYALIYESHVPDLRAKDAAEENRVRMSVDNILTNTAPVADATSAEVQSSETLATTKPKKLCVTRVDVIKRAEALNIKAPTIATPKAVSRALAQVPQPLSAVAVVIPQPNTAIDQPPSVPGSVHDSADDESELSDTEDKIANSELNTRVQQIRPLFPNLPLGREAGDSDGSDSDDSTVRGLSIKLPLNDELEDVHAVRENDVDDEEGSDEDREEEEGEENLMEEREQAEEIEDEEKLDEEMEEEQELVTAGHVPAGGFMTSQQEPDRPAEPSDQG